MKLFKKWLSLRFKWNVLTIFGIGIFLLIFFDWDGRLVIILVIEPSLNLVSIQSKGSLLRFIFILANFEFIEAFFISLSKPFKLLASEMPDSINSIPSLQNGSRIESVFFISARWTKE